MLVNQGTHMRYHVVMLPPFGFKHSQNVTLRFRMHDMHHAGRLLSKSVDTVDGLNQIRELEIHACKDTDMRLLQVAAKAAQAGLTHENGSFIMTPGVKGSFAYLH